VKNQIPLASLQKLEVAEKVFLDFLQSLMDKSEKSTSMLRMIRSALSSLFRIVFSKAFGENYQAQLLARNIRNRKPRRVKHRSVFDIAQLIDHYRAMPDNTELSDQELQGKLATMLILFIQLRPQDILRLDMSHLEETADGLFFETVIKNAPEFSECVLSVVQELKLCPVQALKELWKRVSERRKDTTVLFWNGDYTAPLSKMQLEKNMRKLMQDAGIPDKYSPYSIKHAAITHLLSHDVPEWVVNRNARLSQFTNTATRHYFVGQANQIASRAIATAEKRVLEIVSPLDTVTSQQITSRSGIEEQEEEQMEDEDKEEEEEEGQQDTPQQLQEMPLSTDSNEPLHQGFSIQESDWDGLQITPSITYDETGGDFSLFSSVCCFLSSFASGNGMEEHIPSGCRGSKRRGRGQLAESVCTSHAGLRSHSPDQPPLSPNSGSLSQ
jgi:site-specific recombinase XerD